MSISRRQRRAQARTAQKHFDVLAGLLMKFYDFLERNPQPTDEEVRAKFIDYERRWKTYCSDMQLTKEAYLMFNQEVGLSWKSRYAKKESTMN